MGLLSRASTRIRFSAEDLQYNLQHVELIITGRIFRPRIGRGFDGGSFPPAVPGVDPDELLPLAAKPVRHACGPSRPWRSPGLCLWQARRSHSDYLGRPNARRIEARPRPAGKFTISCRSTTFRPLDVVPPPFEGPVDIRDGVGRYRPMYLSGGQGSRNVNVVFPSKSEAWCRSYSPGHDRRPPRRIRRTLLQPLPGGQPAVLLQVSTEALGGPDVDHRAAIDGQVLGIAKILWSKTLEIITQMCYRRQCSLKSNRPRIFPGRGLHEPQGEVVENGPTYFSDVG